MTATLNYTTTVPVAKTVGEIQAILADAGADAVATKYQDRIPVGVSFLLDTPNGQRHFDLPINVAGVHRMLTLDQVMLPYLRVATGTTLYELYRSNEQQALEGPTDA